MFMIVRNINKSLIFIYAIMLLITLTSCDLDTPSEINRDNPEDPESDNYVPPQAEIISAPQEGEVVSNSDVTITWKGNNDNSEFSYRLTDFEWSDWSANTSTTFTFLDEKTYTFEVKSRDLIGGIESEPASVNFSVDAVKGPAFTFYRRHSFPKAGDSFSVDVIAEEVNDLFAASVEVLFDPNLLQVTGITAYENDGDFLKSNGGDVFPFFDFDNQSGRVWIDIGVAAGDPVGVTGSGALANIQFRALRSGNSPVRFVSNPQMRDPDNNSIIINAAADGIVEID